ncbi:hypothetical protein COF68_04430 [Bacillus toyonensis]|uniref:hypothetical protein n=1 Tax=Bacillus toyonensis TaxID=155322 RepID=UPI000BFDF69F|nr:hypothetical protein [Bacillus toyonensis]PHE64102.1 hypothetical protein COF68_04430 [Bacillus toyonensis]
MTANWKRDQHGTYYSTHITVFYLGQRVPLYLIMKDADTGRWVIGSYNTFTGEYSPFQQGSSFRTLEEAKNLIDSNYSQQV